jgi:hypothetical protein
LAHIAADRKSWKTFNSVLLKVLPYSL